MIHEIERAASRGNLGKYEEGEDGSGGLAGGLVETGLEKHNIKCKNVAAKRG